MMGGSRRNPRERETRSGALRANLNDGLIRDPRVLLDPRLLGMLHRELRERLGIEDTDPVLRQAGFFHGLRDALRLQASLAAGLDGQPIRPVAPLLALDLEAVDDATSRGSANEFVVRGSLPECLEAEAVLSTLGRCVAPACLLSLGYASGWLSGIWDRDVLAREENCAASAGGCCTFSARTVEAWHALDAVSDLQFADGFPFRALRDAVREELGRGESAIGPHFDRSSAAVHVWGPVMVVPYSGEDTADTVEIVAREAASGEISVVIVDLEGAVVDDGFAAVALERVVEVIQSAGAEAVIAGASPLSGRVVSNLGRGGLVVRADLRSAIAAAFQIAEFQRFGM
jgi:anti-anti-sigma regulatory factor